MKRLIRWAFNFAAIVSALLFVATCVLWFREPLVTYAPPWEIVIVDGHVRFLFDGTIQRGENAVPLGYLVVAFLALPLTWAWRHPRPIGFALGLCPSCGYDVRATPDRCPECGTIPKRKT
jgi:hypothetical protein